MSNSADSAWVFGYGSLIWNPDIPYTESCRASLTGYSRRFWQGSHDHRGLPEKPGRVVTLVPAPGEICVGMAYRIPCDVVRDTFEQLDHREKNGYQRHQARLDLSHGGTVDSLVYIADTQNFAYLGDAPMADLARQIYHAAGPSGSNLHYLLALADALRKLNAHDEHVFELEYRVLQIQKEH